MVWVQRFRVEGDVPLHISAAAGRSTKHRKVFLRQLMSDEAMLRGEPLAARLAGDGFSVADVSRELTLQSVPHAALVADVGRWTGVPLHVFAKGLSARQKTPALLALEAAALLPPRRCARLDAAALPPPHRCARLDAAALRRV